MRGNGFRDNRYNRNSGHRPNNYRQNNSSNSNGYGYEPNYNRGGYRPNQYPNYNNVQGDMSHHGFPNSNNYQQQPMNNFQYPQNGGFFNQPPPQVKQVDVRSANKNFENNIEQGERRLNIYKKYLELSESMVKDSDEYLDAFEKCRNAYMEKEFLVILNSYIKEKTNELTRDGIYFLEFQQICKKCRFSDRNVDKAVRWLLNHRANKSRDNFLVLLQLVVRFFIMLLHRKNAENDLVRRLTNVITRLFTFLAGRNNDYKDELIEMINEFSVFFCLMKTYDRNGELVLRWNSGVSNSLLRLDKKFKKLDGNNDKSMQEEYKLLMERIAPNKKFNGDMYNKVLSNRKQINEISNKLDLSKYEKYINDCSVLNRNIKDWLYRQQEEMNHQEPILHNSFTTTPYEVTTTQNQNTSIDNRNWFEKEFYPSYSSLFLIDDNNVQYQPIDPSKYGPLEIAGEVSDDVKHYFDKYNEFLDGDIDKYQLAMSNRNENFENFMNMKKQLRDDAKKVAAEKNTPYSKHFISSLEKVDYKDPREMGRDLRNSDGTISSNGFAMFLSGNI
uniref:MIF4G domain-containing protein n=1 Tax=Strongyloides papillosus TaxID=174720 RepID=A0A0N5BA26_STREA